MKNNLHFLLLLIVSMLATHAIGSIESTASDCAACGDHPDYAPLMALYNSTDGPNWEDNRGWKDGAAKTNCDPCNGWKGVQCLDGRVTVLFLRKLSGSIPSELGSLSELGFLNLTDNQFTGSIPAELGNLSKLEFLYLNRNQLTGLIPKELANLSALRELKLDYNQLTGSIPVELGNLSALELLYLTDNQFTGSIPAELGNLSALDALDLSFNQLTGGIPAELGNLSSLDALALFNNQLTGSIPKELANLSELEFLYLGNNQLTGSIPSQLGSLSELSLLYLSDNQLTGSIPSFDKASSLKRFYCSYNNLSGCYPSKFLCKLDYVAEKEGSYTANGKEIKFYNREGYNISNNPLLPWSGDYEKYCASDGSAAVQEGAPCMIDGKTGKIDANCACVSTVSTTDPEAHDIRIYPNPAHTIIHIEGIEGEDYRLIDVYGRVIDIGSYSNGIDVSDIQVGMYILQVNYRDKRVSKMVQIRR